MRRFLGPATFVVLMLSGPGHARAEEAHYTIITATPVQGAPVDPPPPPPPPCTLQDTVEQRLAKLECETKAMAAELAALRAKTEKKLERERVAGFGAGVASHDGRRKVVLEGNLDYLFGCYYLGSGACVGFVPTINAWRVSVRPLGVGLMFYHGAGEMMSAPYIRRDWDLVITTGGDLDIWENLRARVQVAWFFPNPSDVTDYARRKVQKDFNDYKRKVKKDADRVETIHDQPSADAYGENMGKDYDEFRKDMGRDSNLFGEAYKKAGDTPWVLIGLRWEF